MDSALLPGIVRDRRRTRVRAVRRVYLLLLLLHAGYPGPDVWTNARAQHNTRRVFTPETVRCRKNNDKNGRRAKSGTRVAGGCQVSVEKLFTVVILDSRRSKNAIFIYTYLYTHTFKELYCNINNVVGINYNTNNTSFVSINI